MGVHRSRTVFLILTTALSLILVCMPGSSQELTAEQKLEREDVVALYQRNDCITALPRLEKLAAALPSDAELQEMLGVCLITNAPLAPDDEAGRTMRLRGRQALLRAKEFGKLGTLGAVLLEQTPEDGSPPVFSDSPDVDAAMREGEEAFARHDLDAALAAYQRALALDPKHYEATLFIGDVYFTRRDMGEAVDWFRRAAALDPDLETAHRYLGDALMAQGKIEEARDSYVEAIIAAPYAQSSWSGLLKWARHQKVQLSHPKIESPNRMSEKEGKTNITIDIHTLEKKDGSSSWFLYEISRAAWKKGLFSKTFPDEPTYRHSLAEEADALRMVAQSVAKDLESGEIKKVDPALATLVRLDEEGLLEAYVLFARADEGIAHDYVAYRTDHRPELRRYLLEYVIGEKR